MNLSEIQRYDYGYGDDGAGGRQLGLLPRPDGKLVRYDDMLKVLESIEAGSLSERMLKLMTHSVDKITKRVNAAAEEYEAGRSALGYMEDIAESALFLAQAFGQLKGEPVPPAEQTVAPPPQSGLLVNHIYEVDLSVVPAEYWSHYKSLGLLDKSHVLNLGEIGNMPGHHAIVNKEGRVIFGLHPEMFKPIAP